MKEFIKKFIGKPKDIGIVKSVIMLLVSIFLSVLAVYAIGAGDEGLIASVRGYSVFLLWLNVLPVIILAVFLFFALRRPVFSSIITIVFFAALSLANKIKINMRQDPVIPTDFTLISECKTILQSFDRLKLALGIIALIIVALILISVFLKFKTEKLSKTTRIIGVVICVAAGLISNAVWFSKTSLYDSFPVNGNYYFKVHQYNSKGLLYSFVHDMNFMRVTKPENYQKNLYAEAEKNFVPDTVSEETKKPHVILIMGEAFSDLSDINEHINFDGYTDPMAYYKKLSSEDSAVNGHMIVSSFGGGTSDSEFDVLTGCVTRYINSPKASYSFINSETEGLASFFNNIGYRTIATHPGYAWFYNRQNVYDHMGFSEKFFLEDSFDLEKDGINLYISDEAAFNFLIDKFDEHIEQYDNPLFSFCVTIENHGPYTDKYTEENTFNLDISLEDLPEEDAEADMNLLSNYFIGIQNFDKGLKALTEHLEASGEPVIVAVFGDHLPGFSNGFDIFTDMDYNIDPNGSIEEALNLYKTPFLIWETSAAKEIVDVKAEAEKIGLEDDNAVISANYFGSALMEILGYKNLSPYFNYLSEARNILPVSTNSSFLTGEGIYTNTLTDEQQKIVSELKGWTYYKMFD